MIIKKPPSAELRPNQKDSDSLPDYGVVDAVLQAYVEDYLSPDAIAKKYKLPIELVLELIRRIHRAEFRRRIFAIRLWHLRGDRLVDF